MYQLKFATYRCVCCAAMCMHVGVHIRHCFHADKCIIISNIYSCVLRMTIHLDFPFFSVHIYLGIIINDR